MSDKLSEPNHSLDEFYDQLQDTVIEQARRLINHNLYTKAILSTLPIALVATDRSGRIRSINRAAEDLLGLGSLGENASLVTCFPQDQFLQEKITRCLEAGEASTLDSHSLVTASGNQNVVNIYLQPLRDDESELCGLLIALEDQTYISFLQDSVQHYSAPLQSGSVVSESKPMQRLMTQVAELGQDDKTVLLIGEPGCGKTFVAGKIHEAAGLSSSAPYFVIDCRTLTDKSPRDFLFGAEETGKTGQNEIHFRSVHDYGAIHLADGGSLVLQHVEILPLDAQQAVVDFLEQENSGFLSHINVRIMATSCVDLNQLAVTGEFNSELAKLLMLGKLELPNLWKRRKDILPLARLFLQESENGAQRNFSKSAENVLISTHYSHNNAIELRESVALAALVSNTVEILPECIFSGPKEEEASFEVEISQIPVIHWALQDRVLGSLRYLTLAFFSLLAIAGLLFSDSGIGQFANSLVWGLWWPALIIVFLLLGRLWCTVCPLSTAAYLAKGLFTIGKPPPAWLKKYSFLLLPAGFLLILWVEHAFHMTISPAATGVFLLSLMALAALFGVLFERETWCRYLCPLGSLGAIYSLPAILNVRSNPSVCATLCTTHECLKGSETQLGCPVFHHPLYAQDAHVCKLCFNCLKSCPHDSAKLHLRPPLARIWRQGELGGALGLFALTIFFISPVLLGSKSLAQLSSVTGFSIATLLAIGATLLCYQLLPNRLARDPEQGRLIMSRIAFTLMIFGWGPLTAFQIANFPAVDSLMVIGNLDPVWSHLVPDQGLSLLKLAQTGILLLAALLAGITFWGVRQRLRKDQINISIIVWLVLIGLFGGYLGANLALIFWA